MIDLKPVCWTTETQIAKAQADPGHNMVIWGEPLPHHPDIALVRLSDAEARIKELERERDEATGTLRYCEQQWAEERGTMIDKFVHERARAEAAEVRLKEAKTALEPFAAILEEYDPLEDDDDLHGTLVVGSLVSYSLSLGHLRAAIKGDEQ